MFFLEMLAKGMHQIAQIEFENYICLSFGEETPPHIRHPIFNGQRIIKTLAKASKQER